MKKATPKPKGKTLAPKTAALKKKPARQAAPGIKIVHDEWDSYAAMRAGAPIFTSFDELVTRGKPPAELKHCARVILPIHTPNEAGGPVSPESEQLYDMEDELCALLAKHKARCRLVARLTYGGWRELVFQLQAWREFRTPVGLWMQKHPDYQVEVSEHEGWGFFHESVRPTEEDRLWMADRNVVNALLKSGSNPKKKHSLEYAFQGDAKGLRRVATALLKRGYKALGQLDYDSGTIEVVKRLALDLAEVAEESRANLKVADKAGVEFLGWGAAVVE